jgi:hypothetical protein
MRPILKLALAFFALIVGGGAALAQSPAPLLLTEWC